MPILYFLAHKYPHEYREYLRSRLVLSSLAHLFIKSYLRSQTFFSCSLVIYYRKYQFDLDSFPPSFTKEAKWSGKKNAIFNPFSPFVNSFKCILTYLDGKWLTPITKDSTGKCRYKTKNKKTKNPVTVLK